MNRSVVFPSLVLSMFAAACGSANDDGTGTGTSSGGSMATGGTTGAGGTSGQAPTVTVVIPADVATGVATNTNVAATFSEAMDCATLNAATFTVSSATTVVPGTVICAGAMATFWPAAHLASNELFTATISTGSKSAGGVGLAKSFVWSFTTGSLVAAGQPVNLGKASEFAILAKAGISTVPTSAITGNIGVSPVAADAITGFALTADASNVFSMSTQVTGKVYAANYAVPTPSNLTTAVSDMELAFTDAGARAPDSVELGAGNIGGMTLAPGVYKWSTGLLIPTDVTLAGSSSDVWVFQVAQNVDIASATHVTLTGGAQAKNVFWQVAGLLDVHTTAHFEGVVLTQTSITVETGASFKGRMLAQTAVSIDSNTIVAP